MATSYQLHPKIGVARVGSSQSGFYIGPESIGGMPYECDQRGNERIVDGKPVPVRQFKDAAGAVKRQGARFAVYRQDGDTGHEVMPGVGGVIGILDSAFGQQEADLFHLLGGQG